MMPGCSKTVNVLPENINTAFGYCYVILLRDLYFAVSHLITEQVRGRVQFGHHRAVGVAEVVIFERDAKLFLDLTGGILERIDRLDRAVGQTVDKFRGIDFASVQIFNQSALLFPEVCEPHFILRPLLG